MISAKRLKQVAVPRQVAMYLTKKLMGVSLPEIGKKFGGRDHTTVLHAVKKIEEMIKDDQELASSIKYLKTLIGC
jgi:chromosomal replication initiator protein